MYTDFDLKISAGLMTLAAAKSFGATSLTITDISPQNIELAKKMGATNAYCHSRTATPQEIADYLKKMLLPYGPEIIIDCVGFESTVQTAVRSCCMGGKVVVVGMGQDNMTLPMSTIGVHELDVLGCFRYANTVSCHHACKFSYHSAWAQMEDLMLFVQCPTLMS